MNFDNISFISEDESKNKVYWNVEEKNKSNNIEPCVKITYGLTKDCISEETNRIFAEYLTNETLLDNKNKGEIK